MKTWEQNALEQGVDPAALSRNADTIKRAFSLRWRVYLPNRSSHELHEVYFTDEEDVPERVVERYLELRALPLVKEVKLYFATLNWEQRLP